MNEDHRSRLTSRSEYSQSAGAWLSVSNASEKKIAWIRCNPLKIPESTKGIQTDPKGKKPFYLV
jgi:hypothetical protein